MIYSKANRVGVHLVSLVIVLTSLLNATPSYAFDIVPGADLEGVDLSGRNLDYARLYGANLSNSNLTGAQFAGADFRYSNLSGANLTQTWSQSSGFAYANLTNANLTSAIWPGADLTGADLTGANLTDAILSRTNYTWTYFNKFNGAKLTGANLTRADLSGVDFTGADFTGAILKDVNLTNANLANINFKNQNLDGAAFANANLTGVVSGGVTGTPSSLPVGWQLINGYLIGPGANLDGADLSNLNLDAANLDEARFVGAELSNVSFIGAELTDTLFQSATLTGANLSNANLSNANLEQVTSGDITGTPSNLPTGWKLFNGFLIGKKANLTGADLSGATLAGINLLEANLTNVNFRNLNLEGTNLSNTILTGVISGGITGTPTSIPTGWKLISGYFIGPGANLEGADLKPLTLNGVSSGGVTGTPSSLPIGWKLINGYLIGPGANLANANLADQNLAAANLINATLTGVRSGGITGTPTSLPTGWKLINGYLIGSGANLTDAILTSQNLNGAVLANANLTGVISGGITGTPSSLPTGWKLVIGYLIGPGANLDEANLANANLLGVRSGGITGTPLSLPAGWKLISGYLIGPGANLNEAELAPANLAGVISGEITGTPISLPTGWKLISGYLIGPGANLDGANLANTNLSDAEFTDAVLSGVSSGGITGTPSSLPSTWRLVNGYLIGPGANLRDANLFGFDLEGADLRGANLTQADLRGASLEQANLEGAILDRVKSGGTLGLPSALPERWILTGSYLIGPKALIAGLDLSGTDLTGVSSGGVTGVPAALPEGWSLIAGYLVGPGANLENSNISGVDLSSIDLTNANLRNATLSDVVLTGATLEGTVLEGASLINVSSGNLKGNPLSVPSNWIYKYGYLFGPQANLSNALLRGADLSGFNLTGVNFHSAKLSDVNLVGANLDSAIFYSADITRADFAGARVTNANFTGTFPSFSSVWVEDQVTGLVVLVQKSKPFPTVLGSFNVGETLTAIAGTWDAGVTLGYQWLWNGIPIEGATAPLYQLVVSDLGELISVSVTGSLSGHETVTRVSESRATEAGFLTNSPTPIVSGTSMVGQTLSVLAGNWDTDVTLEYQWLRDGVSILGETSTTLLLSPADSGRQISVEVSGVKTGYLPVKNESVPLLVEPGNLSGLPIPTISGTFRVGQALTAVAGNWGTDVTLSYKWLRNGVEIGGATNQSFTTTVNDFGKSISLAVSGSREGFNTATIMSLASKVTTGLMISVIPKISGLAKSGSTLKATTIGWAKGAKISYQWLANGVAIKAANSSTFKLTAAQKGKKITVKVTQIATGYSSASLTSVAVQVSK